MILLAICDGTPGYGTTMARLHGGCIETDLYKRLASMLFTSSSHAHAKLYMTSCCGRYLKDEQKERLPDILANAMLRAEDFAKLDPGMVARILEKMKW